MTQPLQLILKSKCLNQIPVISRKGCSTKTESYFSLQNHYNNFQNQTNVTTHHPIHHPQFLSSLRHTFAKLSSSSVPVQSNLN